MSNVGDWFDEHIWGDQVDWIQKQALDQPTEWFKTHVGSPWLIPLAAAAIYFAPQIIAGAKSAWAGAKGLVGDIAAKLGFGGAETFTLSEIQAMQAVGLTDEAAALLAQQSGISASVMTSTGEFGLGLDAATVGSASQAVTAGTGPLANMVSQTVPGVPGDITDLLVEEVLQTHGGPIIESTALGETVAGETITAGGLLDTIGKGAKVVGETIYDAGGAILGTLAKGAKALSGTVEKAGGWGELLGTVLQAGTALALGEEGRKTAAEAADIQAGSIQAAIDADMEKFYKALDITEPFRAAGLEALGKARGILEEGPGPGEEALRNALLESGRREGARMTSLRGGPTGRGVEEAARRAVSTDLRVGQEARENFLLRLNPELALAGAGQVASGQAAGLTERAGAREAAGIRDIGEAKAGGRVSGFNVFAPAIATAGEEFYNWLLNRTRTA